MVAAAAADAEGGAGGGRGGAYSEHASLVLRSAHGKALQPLYIYLDACSFTPIIIANITSKLALTKAETIHIIIKDLKIYSYIYLLNFLKILNLKII